MLNEEVHEYDNNGAYTFFDSFFSFLEGCISLDVAWVDAVDRHIFSLVSIKVTLLDARQSTYAHFGNLWELTEEAFTIHLKLNKIASKRYSYNIAFVGPQIFSLADAIRPSSFEIIPFSSSTGNF